MAEETLVEALEREHREIDAGIHAYNESGDPQLLQRAIAALRRHIYLEEEFLFPPLRDAGTFGPIMVMLREHGELWTRMDVVTSRLEGGAGDVDVTAACHAMLAQLAAHNAKEEPIIYPQAQQVLSPAATAQLQEFIGSGQLPTGWVCEQAGR